MSNYSIGDLVMYGLTGACRVEEIGPLSFGGPGKIYYSMVPVYDTRSMLYLPVSKEEEINGRVMSADEARVLLAKLTGIKAMKYQQNTDRSLYESIVKSGDKEKIYSMILMFRNLRKENRKSHKGLNISDEKMMRDAERVLFSEISAAIGCTMKEAMESVSVLEEEVP